MTINQRLALISGTQQYQAPALAPEHWQPRTRPAHEEELLGRGGGGGRGEQHGGKQLWEVNTEDGMMPTCSGLPGSPEPWRRGEAGEEAVIRQQHLQSRAGSATAGKRSLLLPCAINPECPVEEAPALPCPPGALPGRQRPSPEHTGSWALLRNRWKCSPWFPVATNCQGSYRNPQAQWLVRGWPSREAFPASILPFSWQWGSVVPGWRSCIDRQKPRAGLESYSQQNKHSSAYRGVWIDSAVGCVESGFGHQMAAGQKEQERERERGSVRS